MPDRKTLQVGAVAAFILLLGATFIRAEPQTTRLVVDATANRYHALKEFLALEGYWQDEVEAVLGPLDGQLSLNNGTPDAHLVSTLDDIPGLRPLPDGAIEFLHGHHNVYYVAVGRDRLLVGISSLVTQEEGQTLKSTFHFEKFDLIEGHASIVSEDEGRKELETFMYAHGTFLGPMLRLMVLGAGLLVFLAVRLRREDRRPAADPVVAFGRRQGQVRLFQVSGMVWVLMLVAIYGLMHFSARINFMEYVAVGDAMSGSLTSNMALGPDRLRLTSFLLAVGLALLTVILLGRWSGALFGGRQTPATAVEDQT